MNSGYAPAPRPSCSVPLALRQPVRLELAQEAVKEAAMALVVAQNADPHVLGRIVDAVGVLDDRVVVLDRAGLCLDHALDDVDDVGLLVRRLEELLLSLEVHRAWHDAVELL